MERNIFIICLTISLLSLMGSVSYYKIAELKSLEKNIETAIAKGIDPLAVKCAYNNSTTNVCLSYSISQSQTPKK
jgi:hypothetical protein